MINFVTLEIMGIPGLMNDFIQKILFGMVLVVLQAPPAASSITLPGSVRLSLSPPLMTWRSGFVTMEMLMTLQCSFLNFIFNSKKIFCLQPDNLMLVIYS